MLVLLCITHCPKSGLPVSPPGLFPPCFDMIVSARRNVDILVRTRSNLDMLVSARNNIDMLVSARNNIDMLVNACNNVDMLVRSFNNIDMVVCTCKDRKLFVYTYIVKSAQLIILSIVPFCLELKVLSFSKHTSNQSLAAGSVRA